MKRSAYLLIFTIALLTGSTIEAKQNTKRNLEIKGRIRGIGADLSGTGKVLDSVFVIVTDLDNNHRDTIISTEDGDFTIALPLGDEYTLTVMKAEFQTKKIHIDTRVPRFGSRSFTMDLGVSLYRSIPGLTAFSGDNASTEIQYEGIRKGFEYDRDSAEEEDRYMEKIYYAYYHNQSITLVVFQKQRPLKHKNREAGKSGLKIYSLPFAD